jgi:hypothetical protein
MLTRTPMLERRLFVVRRKRLRGNVSDMHHSHFAVIMLMYNIISAARQSLPSAADALRARQGSAKLSTRKKPGIVAISSTEYLYI